jgi:hypothetical protein
MSLATLFELCKDYDINTGASNGQAVATYVFRCVCDELTNEEHTYLKQKMESLWT